VLVLIEMMMENHGFSIQLKKQMKSYISIIFKINNTLIYLLRLSPDNEYLPIEGDSEFIDLSLKLAYGPDFPGYKNKTIAGI
jgi:hypothetical protein